MACILSDKVMLKSTKSTTKIEIYYYKAAFFPAGSPLSSSNMNTNTNTNTKYIFFIDKEEGGHN